MQLEEEILHKIWETELEILDVIHRVCIENNLKYSLAFGSLIGAVRHGGFIPWDDDIDIIMPREDYQKLLSLWRKYAPEDYMLQNKETNEDFTQNFTKIRKNHTTFLQDKNEQKKSYHKGIFVDITPCDRVPKGRLLRALQYAACAINLLYSRGYISGDSGFIRLAEEVLLKISPKIRQKIRRLSERIIRLWNGNDTLEYICSDTIQNCRRYLPPELFDNNVLTQFQDKNYYIIANPDSFLHVRYGDYMKLPTEEEQVWKHHPIIIDFEHNYEELGEQV